MRLVRILVSWLVIIAIVVGASGTLLTGWILLRSLPQHTGTLHVAALDDTVTVRRDENGFVHIYASTPHDLFLAQGYVHASERMWQMEVFRRVGAGRLSELFGKSQLDTDKFVRTLGWHEAAEADIAASSPEVRAGLAAYAEGVNAWLADNRYLSLPFVVTGVLSGKGGFPDGFRPEPWTPADSAVFAKTQGWVLSGNFASELFRFLLARKVDTKAVGELYAPPDPANPTIVGGRSASVDGGPAVAQAPAPPSDAMARDAMVTLDPAALTRLLAVADGVSSALGAHAASTVLGPGGAGSNEWAVSPERSKSGFALLANDPHLAVSMPSVWFVVGLHCRPLTAACPYDVAGVSFPSTPGVILGHNRHIAWGATNSGADAQDLFVEKLAAGDPTRYEYKGELRDFETHRETIKVSGGDDVTLDVRATVHGPVLDDVVKPLAPPELEGGGLEDPGYVMTLRWTALVGGETSLDTFLLLDRARDYGAFRTALRAFGGPAQNFLYADDEGHIAYQLAGHIPIRAGGHDGSVPVPGWDGAADWTGYVPFDKLPRLLDPAGGAIVTANNAPVGADDPYFLGREWDAGYRAARITELLAAKKVFSAEDFRMMQLDDRLLRAAPLIAAVADATPATADGKAVRARMARWDGTASLDSLGAAAAEGVAYRLARDVFDDELGDGVEKDALARRYVGGAQSRGVLVRMLKDEQAGKPPSRWWDDVRTKDVIETPQDIIDRALDEAGADLRTALGDPSQWTWGRLHRMVYREPTLGSSGIAPFQWLFDRGPQPVAGSGDAVNDTIWTPSVAYPDPYDPAYRPADLLGVFETRIAPSYRGVYDTGDWDAASIVSTTGQSEHPMDRHFADLIDPWLAGDLLPFPFSDSAVKRATIETLTLAP